MRTSPNGEVPILDPDVAYLHTDELFGHLTRQGYLSYRSEEPDHFTTEHGRKVVIPRVARRYNWKRG